MIGIPLDDLGPDRIGAFQIAGMVARGAKERSGGGRTVPPPVPRRRDPCLQRPDQRVALEDPAACRIYVTRDTTKIRRNIKIAIFDGDTRIGSLVGGDFLCWERRPGRFLLRTLARSNLIEDDEEALLSLDTEVGGVYYCEVGIEVLDGALVFQELAAEAGRERVAGSKPAG